MLQVFHLVLKEETQFSNVYYNYTNSELEELNNPTSETNFTNQLLERKTKINYVNLPIGLKLKTPEFGLLTYYGSLVLI